jgi:hypothetical protein
MLAQYTCVFLDKVHRGIFNPSSSAQWPNNVVPYVLEAAFTSADRAIIAAVSNLNIKLTRSGTVRWPYV